jgi:hypothetical protein
MLYNNTKSPKQIPLLEEEYDDKNNVTLVPYKRE